MKLLQVILIPCLIFSSASHASENNFLRIHGSNTVGASLMPELLKAWLKSKAYNKVSTQNTASEEYLITAQNAQGKQIIVELHAHGSSTSFKDLKAGKADLGMSSRPIKAKEIQALKHLGDMSKHSSEYVIALDGLSVIVHPDNPLSRINKSRLTDIFSGKLTHWSQLGITGGRINVYARDDKSGTYDTFKSLVLGKKTPLLKSARRYESNARLSDDVAKDRNGIGFVGLAYVRKSRALAIADEGARALRPLPFNVGTEDYALARRLFLYLPATSQKPLLKQFAEFAVSSSAQAIVDKVGFVSQDIHAQPYKLSADAPKEYVELTQGAKRLSLNIRFRKGDIKLDNKAVRDIHRLAKFVSQMGDKKRKLMLFGFSDPMEGLPYASYSLSISRADAVADQFVSNHIIPSITRAYGSELPVANNKTSSGQFKNRRVEVWIK